MDREHLEQTITELEPSVTRVAAADRAAVAAPADTLRRVLTALRNDQRFAFDMLLDHTAVDHLAEGQFELIYNLYSTAHGHSMFVCCRVDRNNPVVPTAEALWPIAHWQEREAYDLFGILYDGHSDLRRVFLEDDWQGHPLRKDYKDPDMLEFPK
jgi:NADH-quinone oxidoreductase subunit C